MAYITTKDRDATSVCEGERERTTVQHRIYGQRGQATASQPPKPPANLLGQTPVLVQRIL